MISRLLLIEEFRLSKQGESVSRTLESTALLAPEPENQMLSTIEKFNRILYKSNIEVSLAESESFLKEGLGLLNLLQKRNEQVRGGQIDGEELDELDLKLYELEEREQDRKLANIPSSMMKKQQAPRNFDGERLSEKELEEIRLDAFEVISLHDIGFIHRDIQAESS